ncbi:MULTISPECIES: hypothetical protein [Streptomyces]|uniref:Uncharacterized protein n=2 Tax=Streptomyces TaxID=1883 RepID=A0ABV9J7T0_9ACTN
MPKSPEKNSGTTEYSAEVLKTYRDSQGYLPGMRDESQDANDQLAYYKQDPIKVGDPSFVPAAHLVEQMVKVVDGLTNELTFNFSITDTMIVTLSATGEAMEAAEENGTLSGSKFGELVGKAINERGGGSGSGTTPPNPKS